MEATTDPITAATMAAARVTQHAIWDNAQPPMQAAPAADVWATDVSAHLARQAMAHVAPQEVKEHVKSQEAQEATAPIAAAL